MVEESESIGQRLRRARLRLGLTQADVAARLRRTQSWVSKVESGDIELDRASVINALAGVLHIHPNELIERPFTGSTAENQWRVSAAMTLRELRRYDLAPTFEGTPASSAALWGAMRRLHRLRDDADNTGILGCLPDLLREARALAEAATGAEREAAFAVYAVACKFAHTSAHALGHPELITLAAERATWAAERSGDPLLPAVVDWMRAWDMWATADWDDALALGDKALRGISDAYERGEPAALRVWGSLQLRAAVSSARAGNAQEADHRLELAGEAARRMAGGPELVDDRHSLTFSAGNVGIHGVNVALELSRQDEALRRHERLDPAVVAALPASRRGHYRMDLARAHLWSGQRDLAVAELSAAERIAPQLVRNHPIARATLRRIVYGERTGVREQLRRMSARFHLSA
ncbi:helix-turn-helix domain-containing protein [Streptomyces triticirhizae]|uniref:XRE family transcriptional regulator n=1 Tax=Streptomyces triticirhizae TaxID=2483353 RepID=A0A3M2LWT3_9ACTN|nr:helix-turn-helix transcriptional regulator [Streptomyces triticirhizae]RMI40475.1 XRE family transcriptional regulator [Streptomyces triticirhizae]